MTLDHRARSGWEVRCDADGCTATTATHGNRTARARPTLALQTAQQLGWLQITIGGQQRDVCAHHQQWEPRLNRWVAIPHAVTA